MTSRQQQSTYRSFKGDFFLTSRFESSEAHKVLSESLTLLSDAMSDSLSNLKFKSIRNKKDYQKILVFEDDGDSMQ